MIIKNIARLLMMLLLLSSCNKDTFIETQKEIDDFRIASNSIQPKYEVTQLDSLKIYPELNNLNPNKTYTYEWRLYAKDKFSILSENRNLEEQIFLNIGTHSVQYSVIDQDTKIKAISILFSIRVMGGFSQGWIVGNNVGGRGRLSFIRTIDDVVSYNTLEDVNERSYPSKLIAAYSGAVGSEFSGQFKQILYFTQQGLMIFHSDSMIQTGENNNYFFDEMNFFNKPAYDISGFLLDQYLIDEGKLYAAIGQVFMGDDGVDYGPFSTEFEGDHDLFPFVFTSSGSPTYFYDNKYEKFLTVEYLSRSFDFPTTAMINGQFELNNVAKEMIAADKGKSNNSYAIMKDRNSNTYYIYYFPFSTRSAVSSGRFFELSTNIGLNNLSAFAASNIWDYAYYATENSIYKIDCTNGDVSLFQDLGAGNRIADIKVLKHGDNSGLQLTVAINKGDNGEVHYIPLTQFGDKDSSQEIKIFKGFGEITNLSYRIINVR